MAPEPRESRNSQCCGKMNQCHEYDIFIQCLADMGFIFLYIVQTLEIFLVF